MIRRAIDGRARLVSSEAAAHDVDAVLSSISWAPSQSAWPLLKLHTDLGDLWLVEGADPVGDPPERFTAGWSLSAFSSLAGRPDQSEELIEQIIEQYLADVESTVRPLLGPEGHPAKTHWTRESYLAALPNDEERRLAELLMDRVLDQGRIWYGVEGGGGLNLHYRQNSGPIALTLRGDGHAGMYGLWNTWNRSKNNPAYRPIAEFVDQSYEGPASSIRLVDLDFEDLWAAIGETAELLRGVAGVEPIEPPESEPAES